jgi:hypothetical protein
MPGRSLATPGPVRNAFSWLMETWASSLKLAAWSMSTGLMSPTQTPPTHLPSLQCRPKRKCPAGGCRRRDLLHDGHHPGSAAIDG